jgi:hypothetical protein
MCGRERTDRISLLDMSVYGPPSPSTAFGLHGSYRGTKPAVPADAAPRAKMTRNRSRAICCGRPSSRAQPAFVAPNVLTSPAAGRNLADENS